MTDLLLHEQRVEAVLDEMGHVAVTQTMQGEALGQTARPGRAGERRVDPVLAHDRSSFRGPQPGAITGLEVRPDVLDPLAEHLGATSP